jgi:hypothetical protein
VGPDRVHFFSASAKLEAEDGGVSVDVLSGYGDQLSERLLPAVHLDHLNP